MCEIANLSIESIESAIDIAGNAGQVCGKVVSGEFGSVVDMGVPGALGVSGALVGPAANGGILGSEAMSALCGTGGGIGELER